MSFYSSIAPYYDMLFPYDPVQIQFLEEILNSSGEKFNGLLSNSVSHRSYLDVGCGTGTILSEFSDRFHKLAGIDLDTELLKIAAEKMYPGEEEKVELLNEDMMEIKTIFRDEQFSFITCLGNTLPHLTGVGKIPLFLKNVFDCLEANGIFVFQTINFDRVIDKDIRNLPTIEKGKVVFERYYSSVQSDGLIHFDTILSDIADDIEIKNSTKLYPVRHEKIVEYIKAAGFNHYKFFGDYSGSEYEHDSFLMIGVCRK